MLYECNYISSKFVWLGPKKNFNTINMFFSFSKVGGMINAFMVKSADIQRVIRVPRISIDHAIRIDFTGNYGHQPVGFGIGNDHRVNLSLPFKNTKYDHFTCRTSTPFSFTTTPK